MNRQELIAACLKFDDALEDYPFEDMENTIMRHKLSKKWFALIFERDDKLCINVKADPMDVVSLCDFYKGAAPGWHMNKRHWVTITLNEDIADDDVIALIHDSYRLTMK